MATLKVTKNFKTISRLFSAQNLTQKAYMNALAATLDYGARLISGFIVTPFLVAGLGDTFYGVWRTLGNLTGYISAASGRPSQALKWTIANLQNSTDYVEKRRQVASALIVWLIFLPLLTGLGGVVAWFAPQWIKDLPVELYGIVRVAAALLVADMIITTLTVIPQSILEGENLGYKRMGLSATLVFVGGGLAMLALYLETGLIGVAVAELVTTLLTGLFFFFVLRNYVPWIGLTKPAWSAVRQFLQLSSWFLVWRLVSQLMTASDLVILGMFASPEVVTTYSLTKYAPETLINFVAILLLGITPGLGGIIGKGDLRRAARVRGEIMLLTWLVATVIGSTILLWNRAFVGLWVGGERYGGTMANFWILLLIVQFVLIRNDANIIDLTLNLSNKTVLGLASTALSIALAVLLVGYYQTGILGLIWGLMSGRLLLSLVYPLLIGRFLSVSLRSQLLHALRPMAVTVLLFLVAARLDSVLNTPQPLGVTWVSLFFLVAATAGAMALLAFVLGLSGEQQKHLFKRLQLLVAGVER